MMNKRIFGQALKRLFAVLAGVSVSLALLFIPARAQEREDLRVISIDDFGLTLELTPPPFSVENVKGLDGSYQRLHVQGWASTNAAGHPELPAKGVLIQVPHSGGITVEVLENSSRSTLCRRLCPVPRLTLSGEGERVEEFERNSTAYGACDFFPATAAAEVSPRGLMRGVSVARVLFYPFQWNPATEELRFSQTMRVRIHFDEPLPRSDIERSLKSQSSTGDLLDDFLKMTVLNYRREEGSTLSARRGPVSKQGASQSTGLRIEVKQDEVCRISYDDLRSARISPARINPDTFRLLNLGQEIAINVVTKELCKFSKGDYIEFYGRGADTAFTDTNVYWLHWGESRGKRVTKIDGSITGQGDPVSSFESRLHAEENHIVWGGSPGAPEQDYWTWEQLTAPATKNYRITVPSPVTGGSDALVRVCFRGYTIGSPHPNHHTRIRLNSTSIGEAYWDGDMEYVQEIPVSSSLLTDGVNTLTVELPGDTGASTDSVLLNWIELDYSRRFEAVEDSLTFRVEGTGRLEMEIKNLSRPDVVIYDITDPSKIGSISRFEVNQDGGSYRAVFEDVLSGPKTYCVAAGNGIKKPERLEPWRSTGLKSRTAGADYILITARDFLPSVKPLMKLRQEQELRVKAVSVEEIYNEFNFGLPDSQAIKDFLTYAYKNWRRPAPAYVFLLGDANIDYRGYLGTGKKSRVPAHFSITSALGLVPDDNWYVAVEGDDDLPEMMIGRVSAATPERAADVVHKIIGYEGSTSYRPRKALFVADNNDLGFENVNEQFISSLPSDYEAERVYLRSYSRVDDATQDILTHMNDGMLLTTYIGHGDMTRWAGEKLFEPSDIPLLNNEGSLTFVMALNCLNGYFSLPGSYSLGEEFVAHPEKGAIAAFVPSGLGTSLEYQMLGKGVFSSIFQKLNSILGIITTQSKIDAYAGGASEELLKTFTLLGDPATRLKTTK